MTQRTVKTKEELHDALKNKVDKIIVADADLAKHVLALHKTKKISKASMFILGGSAVAALGASILTGGTAAPVAIKALAATATTTTGLSTGAIVAICTLGCTTALALVGLLKGYNVHMKGPGDSGEVIIEKK